MGRTKIKLEITGNSVEVLLGIVVEMRKDLIETSGDIIGKDNVQESLMLHQCVNNLIKILKDLDRSKSHSLTEEQGKLNEVNQLISSIIKAVFEPNNVNYKRIPTFIKLLRELIRFFDGLLSEIVSQEIPFVRNVDSLRKHLETNSLF